MLLVHSNTPPVSEEIASAHLAFSRNRADELNFVNYEAEPWQFFRTGDIGDLVASAKLRLEHLSEDLGPDDEPPTGEAVTTYMKLMSSLAAWGHLESPRQLPYVSAMGAGDLSCEWHGSGKKLILTISPVGSLRLHHVSRDADEATAVDSDEPSGARNLAHSVEWVFA